VPGRRPSFFLSHYLSRATQLSFHELDVASRGPQSSRFLSRPSHRGNIGDCPINWLPSAGRPSCDSLGTAADFADVLVPQKLLKSPESCRRHPFGRKPTIQYPQLRLIHRDHPLSAINQLDCESALLPRISVIGPESTLTWDRASSDCEADCENNFLQVSSMANGNGVLAFRGWLRCVSLSVWRFSELAISRQRHCDCGRGARRAA
jgi:hypothetical protein